MTTSDAIQFLKRYRRSMTFFFDGLPFNEAVPEEVVQMAIEALERVEKMEDDGK